ncbi:MAG TPA: DUF6328 family protein [Tepidisphaeraceae bacterium]|jgi:hypothetical protein|nr:DUF6328 family protein [Tepidisphaeraceae bacterium]
MQLKDKIKFAFDEARILILGGQVLVGFGYNCVFQPGFPKLPPLSQYVQLGSLWLMLVGLALAIAPAARDRLVERGEPTHAVLRFATRMIGWALFPFAVGLGVEAFVAVRIVAGAILGLAIGLMTFLLALTLWHGGRFAVNPPPRNINQEEGTKVELKDKIDLALIEARMVLPGVQAMLGFQFIAMLTESFERLPDVFKYVHVASLGMSAVTTILLIAPAAFHRTVEHGEATDRQHDVTTRFLLAAMFTLPPAITGDLLVVFWKVTSSLPLALSMSGVMLVLFYAVWFLPGLTIRARERSPAHSPARMPVHSSVSRGTDGPSRR